MLVIEIIYCNCRVIDPLMMSPTFIRPVFYYSRMAPEKSLGTGIAVLCHQEFNLLFPVSCVL